MKRSKMYEELWKFMDSNNFFPGDWSRNTTRKAANLTLNFLEDKGMLPPPIKNPELPKEIENEFEFAYEQALDAKYNRKSIPSPFYINKWEPEEESNDSEKEEA